MHLLSIGFLLMFPLIIIPFCLSIIRYVNYAQWLKGNEPGYNSINDYTTILDKPTRLELSYEKWKYKWEFPEILFMGIAPILGSFFIYNFQNDIKPFALDYSPTLITYIVLAYVSYWLSRLFKEKLPAVVNMILPYGMLIGLGLYAVLFVHFISVMTIYGGVLLPFLAFPLFAPLPALLYNLRQIKQHNLFNLKQTISLWEQYSESAPEKDLFRKLWWHEGFPNPVFVIGFITAIQIVLYQIGQPFDSLIKVFTESSDFLLSNANLLF